MFPIISFTDKKAASQVASVLENQGVETQVVTESEPEADDVFVLRVRDRDEDRAAAYLIEHHGQSKRSPKAAVLCPSCGSFDFECPCAPQHSISGNLVERFAELVHAKKKAFFFKDCSHVWIPGETPEG